MQNKHDKFLVYEGNDYQVEYLKEIYKYYYEYSKKNKRGDLVWCIWLSDLRCPANHDQYIQQLKDEGLIWV